jgi:hypothetical protein
MGKLIYGIVIRQIKNTFQALFQNYRCRASKGNIFPTVLLLLIYTQLHKQQSF